jgi:ribonuclease H2 subunit A
MPDDLSAKMLHVDGGQNLNQLSYDSAFGLILEVIKMGFKVKRIVCDQVGPPATQIRKMKEFLGYHLDPSTEIICESKADATFPVVSAASIGAKVTRDQILKNWLF